MTRHKLRAVLADNPRRLVIIPNKYGTEYEAMYGAGLAVANYPMPAIPTWVTFHAFDPVTVETMKYGFENGRRYSNWTLDWL